MKVLERKDLKKKVKCFFVWLDFVISFGFLVFCLCNVFFSIADCAAYLLTFLTTSSSFDALALCFCQAFVSGACFFVTVKCFYSLKSTWKKVFVSISGSSGDNK